MILMECGLSPLDPMVLAPKLTQLTAWLDENCRSASFEARHFKQPPFGHAYVTIDPNFQAAAASFNHNRIHLCGTRGGLEPEGLDQLIELFVTAGIRRFFVWLSPGPDMELARQWLRDQKFVRISRTRYPTLMHGGEPPGPVSTDLDIQEVGPKDAARARLQLGEAMSDDYLSSCGKPGFHHFMAFDADRAVAVAALARFDGLGYLTFAGTVASHRRRGAQQAFIARRIAMAQAANCSLILSETLTVLRDSFANLQRAGFHEIYEKEVYEWTAQAAG